MVDKINREECIARVYQFLNKPQNRDWEAKADDNGDGTIVKTEFRAFLYSNFQFNNGENKSDIVDAFWDSIDINKTGKVRSGSKTNNKNALDSTEIKNMEATIKATETILKFMQNKEAPAGIEGDMRARWKKSVKEGMIYRASEFLKSASIEDLTEEWLNETFSSSSAKATADYLANELVLEELKNNNIDFGDYKIDSDDTLKNIINEYIARLDIEPKNEETVINEIKKIVKAYVDTAITNSNESRSLLGEYKYYSDDPLNPLQTAVLKRELGEKILEYIKTNKPEIYTKEYEGAIQSAVNSFIENYLAGKSSSAFASLKSLDISVFTESTEFKNLVEKIKQTQQEIQKIRDELNTYIGTILASGDADKIAAVKDVIGTADAAQVINKLLEFKTLEDIKAKQTELQTKLDGIDAKRAAEETAKQEEYKVSFGQLSGMIEDIIVDNLSSMLSGYGEIHTEFGMDTSGKIVFQNVETKNVYNKIQSVVKAKFKAKNEAAYNMIGESNLTKLIQSAWIMTYNNFNSSQTNSCSGFVQAVLTNLESILSKLSKNPEYLAAYTGHTAYANSKLTTGLTHYNTNTTYGNDQDIVYDGGTTIDSNGTVHLVNSLDDPDYQVTMNALLKKILKQEQYAKIDPEIITSVFRDAQAKAIRVLETNTCDCPYGTGNNGGFVEDTIKDWGGRDNRKGDDSCIYMKELVQITLYYFDKLLFAKLAE